MSSFFAFLNFVLPFMLPLIAFGDESGSTGLSEELKLGLLFLGLIILTIFIKKMMDAPDEPSNHDKSKDSNT